MLPDPHEDPLKRPEFMMTLGLLPPYTLEDVKQAYMMKVQESHPDHGGNIHDFRKIQAAYEQAQEFLAIRGDRRSWIARQMDQYLAQQELEDQLREWGADVVIQHTEWLKQSFGDFAELTGFVEAVTLEDRPHGNDVVDLLLRHQGPVVRLRRLGLPGCGLSSDYLPKLAQLELLEYLDLRRTPLDGRIVDLVTQLPRLRELRVDRSSVSWWTFWRLNRQLKRRT